MSKKLFVTALLTAIALFASGCASMQAKPNAELSKDDGYASLPPVVSLSPLEVAKRNYENKKADVEQTENALAGAKVEKDQAAVGYRDALRSKVEEIRAAQEAATKKTQELLAEADAIGGEGGDFAPATDGTVLASADVDHVNFTYAGSDKWERDPATPVPTAWKVYFKGNLLTLYVDNKPSLTGTVKVGAKYRLTATELITM